METTTTTAETTTQKTTTVPNTDPTKGVFALIQCTTTGIHTTIRATTRTELSKILGGMQNFNVLGIFKGKQLNISEKKSFKIN